MNYERFLTAQEGDFKGRTLEDIWSFSDAEIEYIHDFIQIIFPLDKPSQAAFTATIWIVKTLLKSEAPTNK